MRTGRSSIAWGPTSVICRRRDGLSRLSARMARTAALVPVPVGGRGGVGSADAVRCQGFLPVAAASRQAGPAALAAAVPAGAASPITRPPYRRQDEHVIPVTADAAPARDEPGGQLRPGHRRQRRRQQAALQRDGRSPVSLIGELAAGERPDVQDADDPGVRGRVEGRDRSRSSRHQAAARVLSVYASLVTDTLTAMVLPGAPW